MVYKRYIKKKVNGKTKIYGPYYQHSKKKNGKVISEYCGKEIKKELNKKGKEKNKELKFVRITIFLVALLILSFVFLSDLALTGKVSLSVSNNYVSGEGITGSVKINLDSGELLPASTTILIENGGETYSFLLSDLISEETSDGSYYILNKEISGSGLGYGIAGEKIIYPKVNFVMGLSDSENVEENTEHSGSSQIEEEISEEPEEVIDDSEIEESEEIVEEEIMNDEEIISEEEAEEVVEEESLDISEEIESEESIEENVEEVSEESSEVSSESVEESSESEESSAPITGEAVSNSEIEGTVSYDEFYEYNLASGQTASIVSSEQNVELNIENGIAIVTTNYYEVEEGFGEDYISDDELELEIDLTELNLIAVDGNLNIRLVYDDVEIVSASEEINVEDSEESQIEVNQTIINELDEEVLNETISDLNETVENETIEVNEFVSANLNTTQFGAVVGMPVKWKKNIKLSEVADNLTVELPKEAENIVVYKIEDSDGVIEEKTETSNFITGQVSVDLDSEGEFSFADFFKKIFGSITGRVIDVAESSDKVEVTIDENATEFEIEYETPGPVAFEEETSSGKLITISSEVHYQNILSFAELPRETPLSNIKLYHYVDGERVLADFQAYDSNGNLIEGEEVKIILEDGQSNENKSVLYSSGNEIEKETNVSVKDILMQAPEAPASSKESNDSSTNESVGLEEEIVEEQLVSFITWVVPHLSDQTYEIVIEITKAEHLDSDRNFIEDIYDEVSVKDDVWSNVIEDSEYIRVTFEELLDSSKDITVYARGQGSIEVYLEDGNEVIATIEDISEEGEYKTYLTEMQGEHDVFDLKILGNLEFDLIIDPSWNPNNENDIGYEFLTIDGEITNASDGEVVHIWNTQDDYFFNKSAGIQLTNHFQDYWTRNIFCIGYYNATDIWNKIYCADELSNFNRDIETDNSTYVNATLWKDITYGSYDLRLGVRYHLKTDDESLSVIIYARNIGIDIPFDLGFAWKITDWEISPTENNDWVLINNTNYFFNESHNIIFEDMDEAFLRGTSGEEYLILDWNSNLNYQLKLYSNGSQNSAYTALLIDAGHFNPDQEKQTILHWIDLAGDGTSGNPYQIVNWSDLAEVADHTSSYFILMNDLDSSTAGYSDYANWTANAGAGWDPIDGFTGNFNGQNYTISDLFINRSAEDKVGLFGNLGASAYIGNLSVVDADVTGHDGTGILVGGEYPNADSVIDQAFTNGTVTGNSEVGGVIGTNYFSDVINSYSHATVSGSDMVGGLVGNNYASTITNSYSMGAVSGSSDVGGLIGHEVSGTVTNSFWDNETSGQTSSAGGLGNTTAQMQDITNYNSSWSIATYEDYTTEIWKIDDGNDYPRLGWETIGGGDVANPTVTLNEPADFANYTSATIDLFNCTVFDDVAVQNVTFYWNVSGTFEANGTDSSGTNNTKYSFTRAVSSEGHFVWNCLAFDTSSNSSYAATNRTFNLTLPAADTTAPTFTTVPSNVSDSYLVADVNADFDFTDETSISMIFINDTSNFTMDNSTGVLTNKTPLFVGNYALNVTINDSSNNINWTIFTVAVSQSSNGCNVLFNETSPITFPAQFQAYSDCDSDFTLYLNGSTISNDSVVDSGANTFNISVQRTDIQNYSNTFDDEYFVVSQNSDVCGVYFNASSGITFPDTFIVYTNCSSAYTLSLNGTSISNATEIRSGAGAFNLSVLRDDASNYSSYYSEEEFQVAKATLSASLTSTKTFSYEYDNSATIINLSESNTQDSDVNYTIYKNNITYIPDGESANFPVGTYPYILNSTGGQNYSSNANLDYEVLTITQNTETCQVLFNETSPITYPQTFLVWANCSSAFTLYQNGSTIVNNSEVISGASAFNFSFLRTDASNYSTYYNETQFIVSQDSSICGVEFNETSPVNYPATFLVWSNCSSANYLMRNGTIISNNSEQSLSVGAYNFSTNRTDTTNYSSIYSERQFRVIDIIAPTITILYPLNTSYENVTEINYTSSESGYCMYSFDDGTTNSTVGASTSNFTGVSSSAGQNDLVVYCNDSSNNFGVNNTISFTVDIISPQVTIVLPVLGNTYTSASVTFQVTTDEESTCNYSIDAAVTNSSMTASSGGTIHTASASLSDGSYTVNYFCADLYSNLNNSESTNFSVAISTPPVEQTPSGGGGGGAARPATTFSLSSSSFEKTLAINRIGDGDFEIENTGKNKRTYSMSVETINSIVQLEENSVEINAGEKVKVGFKVISPDEPGIYTGKIIIKTGSVTKEILLTINVKTEKSLFDVVLTIPKVMKELKLGSNLNAQIDLLEMGLKEKKDVTLNYVIKDFEGVVYLTESETFAVTDQKTIQKEFYTENLEPGEYILGTELIYPEGVAVASSQFKIREKIGFEIENTVIIILVAIFLILFVSIALIIRRYRKILKAIK